jgi:NAD(P)H-flavin reductase
MKVNPYAAIPATVENIIVETSNITTFTFRPQEPIPFKAGQFIELSVPGFGEAPFTPSSSPAVTDTMDVTIMRVGAVTERIHALSIGSKVGIRGPLGQPYPLDKFKGREVLIVGGGVGLAPLRALFFALIEEMDQYKKIILRYGARSPADIVYRKAVSAAWGNPQVDLLLSVDKGDESWKGNIGVVTTILESNKLSVNIRNSVAVVCGPPIMMKFATIKLLELGYPSESIYLSMEKNMSCGIGKCGHCRIGPFYACKDGPVFTYDRIKDEPRIWD